MYLFWNIVLCFGIGLGIVDVYDLGIIIFFGKNDE